MDRQPPPADAAPPAPPQAHGAPARSQRLHPGSPHAGRALPRPTLEAHGRSPSLERLGFAGLEAVCREHTGAHAPARSIAVDPRAGLPVVYSEARAHRLTVEDDVCVVCDNQTCPAVDVASLPGDDHAWLTPNLYPIVFPFAAGDGGPEPRQPGSLGVHLVHWSSRHHDRGWPGAPDALAIALHRQLARAEAFLLHHAPASYPDVGSGHRGHIGLIKNRGRKVGGSVEHDHQQILLAAVAPSELAPSAALAPRLLQDAGDGPLLVERTADVTTLVPPFMRRSLQAFVVPHAPGPVGWIHHLPEEVLDATALAVARLTGALNALMTEQSGEPAWNLIWHTGPGAWPLLEMRAFTQPLGGYEHMGIYLCEERPETSARRLREALGRTA